MDYQQFRETKFYKVLSDSMKLAFHFYFINNENGLSFSQLKVGLNKILSEDDISTGLDVLEDNGEIIQKIVIRKERKKVISRARYFLPYLTKSTLSDLHNQISL